MLNFGSHAYQISFFSANVKIFLCFSKLYNLSVCTLVYKHGFQGIFLFFHGFLKIFIVGYLGRY